MAPFTEFAWKEITAIFPLIYPFFLIILSKVGRSILFFIPDLNFFIVIGQILSFGHIFSIFFTVKLKGGYNACVSLVENVKLLSHVANIGDTRSLIIHPASTTHAQLSEDEKIAAGAASNSIRLSIGIESVEDIIKDLDQSL